DVAGVAACAVADPQTPGAVCRFAGRIDGVGADDVVGTAPGAIVQVIDRAIGRNQVDDQVTDVGVPDVDTHLQVGRRIAAAAADGDRAGHPAAVVVRNRDVCGVLEVGLTATTARGLIEAGHQAGSGEGRVGIHHYVVGAGLRRAERAGLGISDRPRAAVV